MKSGIYCYRRLSDGLCYVGQSVDLEERRNQHQRESSRHCYIDNAIKKHGIDAFVFEILELCEEDILDQREIHWIAALDTVHPNGFNLTHGGKGGRPSEETRKKLSKAQKGNQHAKGKRTPETRQRMSESRRGNQNAKGLKHTPETRTRISNANKGYKHTPEARSKISNANKGANNWNHGKPAWNRGKRKHKRSSDLQMKLF